MNGPPGSPRRLALLAVVLLLGGCGGSGGSTTGNALGSGLPTDIEPVFTGLSFDRITDIQSQPDDTGNDRLFVVEQGGTIWYFDPDSVSPTAQLYLDARGIAQFSDAGEQGLLGLAFDPDHEVNGYLYVHLVKNSPRRVVILRFEDTGMLPVSTTTAVTVLEADEYDNQAANTNHVAGGLAFGPVDGYLYLTMGDGGGGNDPDDAAQDRTQLRGSILRIDVGGTTTMGSAPNYDIPDDNPYLGNAMGFREEILAHGLRNPFRISIEQVDATTQRVWVGDVGQDMLEEIDVIEAGGNYGWDCREGTIVSATDPAPACAMLTDVDFTDPVHEYDRSQGGSVTGGYVYRGERLAGALTGRYVYGDFISGRIRAFDPDTGENVLLVDSMLNISTFGTGVNGDLYIGDYNGGLYRLVP